MPDHNFVVPNGGYLRRARSVFAVIGGLYLLAVILLSIPFLQTHVLYMNHFRYPFFTKYDAPEIYGLAPGKTLNFYITTSDNVTLGAWLILSDPYYRSVPFPEPSSYLSLESRVPLAIKARTTILFFHGNAATRAAPFRVQYYKAFSSRLDANVLSIDYRGFGDSDGVPSESGLAKDAHAGWDWLIFNGANPQNILIVGHSLGTAVAAKLSADLASQDVAFKGVVLMSPFSSIWTLLQEYHFFGFLPLMKPLGLIPGAYDYLGRSLMHTFNTLAVIQAIKAPILFVHAENDWDIPYTHSETLFNAILEPLLPSTATPAPATSWSQEDWDKFYAIQSARASTRKELVAHGEIRHFGTVDEFMRPKDGGKVVLLKTVDGGHNKMGTFEGVQDVIRSTFNFH